MTTDEAHRLHRRELQRLLTSDEKHTNRKTTRWLLRETERTQAAVYEETDATTWIWSDLHLHHANIIRYCERPFGSRDEMDEALFDAWYEHVREADTIICVGDLALGGSLDSRRLERVRGMPGRKLLVRGNHDFDRNGRVAATGCDHAWMTLVIPGTPPLVLTHMPLDEMPNEAVNVHGHTHNNTALRAGPYVNVCVEQTEYRPLRLDDVRRLGLARQRDPRPRSETTAGELETGR